MRHVLGQEGHFSLPGLGNEILVGFADPVDEPCNHTNSEEKAQHPHVRSPFIDLESLAHLSFPGNVDNAIDNDNFVVIVIVKITWALSRVARSQQERCQMNENKTDSPAKWPEGYRNWTGDFNDLVSTAGQIVARLNPGTKPPSASLIRHYQQIGCVGRGQKQGRASIFGFNELFQAVAAKDMAGSGMGLDLASQLVNNSAPAMCLAYSDPSPQQNSAQTLVERLVRQSQADGPVGTATAYAGPVRGGNLVSACMAVSEPRPAAMASGISQSFSRHIKPCEGVDVYLAIDPCDPDGLHRAASALRAAADSLEQTQKPNQRSKKS